MPRVDETPLMTTNCDLTPYSLDDPHMLLYGTSPKSGDHNVDRKIL